MLRKLGLAESGKQRLRGRLREKRFYKKSRCKKGKTMKKKSIEKLEKKKNLGEK